MIKMMIIPVLVTALILFMFWLPYSDNEGGMSSSSLDLYRTLNRSGKKYAKKTGFYYMGVGAGSSDDENGERKYDKFKLTFETNKVLTKNEGRILLIKAAEEVKNGLNSNSELREHYLHNPVGIKNVSITFFILDQNRNQVVYPNYASICYREGTLYYYTEKNVNDPLFYTTETETLDEALEIIERGSSDSNEN